MITTIGERPGETFIPGQLVSVTGSQFDGLSKVLIDGLEAVFTSISSESFELRIPESIAPGIYDLQIETTSGTVGYMDAINVVAAPLVEAWTTKISDNQVKMYFKNPQGQGKIQFFVNGKEIAWVKAEDNSDPKLRTITQGPMAGTSYLVRTVDLNPGKNALEVYQDGERIWRAAYSLN